MPNVQVVADIFHVMVQINKELDTQKKRERRQIIEASKKTKSVKKIAEQKERLDGINDSRYSLLKNEARLNKKQKLKLISVKKVCHKIAKMPKLKEKFRDI
jgi:transposase